MTEWLSFTVSMYSSGKTLKAHTLMDFVMEAGMTNCRHKEIGYTVNSPFQPMYKRDRQIAS